MEYLMKGAEKKKSHLRTYLFVLVCFIAFCQTNAQSNDSSSHMKKRWHRTTFFKVAGAPIILTGAGLFLSQRNELLDKYDIKDFRDNQFSGYTTSIDDYTRYAPPATVFILDAAGIKAKHRLKDRIAVFLKANAVALAVTFPLKGVTKVRRPNNSSSASMPSLHTAQAFLGASFLHHEYGERSVWYSITGYSLATLTGIFRVLNDKHWMPDVLIGAAVGILCSELIYITHNFNRKRQKNRSIRATALPAVSPDFMGLSLTLSLP